MLDEVNWKNILLIKINKYLNKNIWISISIIITIYPSNFSILFISDEVKLFIT